MEHWSPPRFNYNLVELYGSIWYGPKELKRNPFCLFCNSNDPKWWHLDDAIASCDAHVTPELKKYYRFEWTRTRYMLVMKVLEIPILG